MNNENQNTGLNNPEPAVPPMAPTPTPAPAVAPPIAPMPAPAVVPPMAPVAPVAPPVAPAVAPEAPVVPAPAVVPPMAPVAPVAPPVAPIEAPEAPVVPAPAVVPPMAPVVPDAPVVSEAPAIAEAPVVPPMGVAPMGTNNDSFKSDPFGVDPALDASAPVTPPSQFDNIVMPPMDAAVDGITSNTVVPEQESVGEIPPKKTKESNTKKILFIALILVLIAAIAFGLFYFLSQGANGKKITLQNKTFEIFEEIPTDMNYYANFENVVVENCTINVSGIDNSVAGEYTYTITCEEDVYTAVVNIVDNRVFDVYTTDAVFSRNAAYSIETFVEGCSTLNCEYTFDPTSEELLIENLTSTGGPYEIIIYASDDAGNSAVVTSEYYVILAVYNATSPLQGSVNYNATYTTTDSLYFKSGNIYLNKGYREFEYTFESLEDYNIAFNEYESIKLFDGITGTPVFDEDTLTVVITIDLTSDMLASEYGSEFPDTYADINTYYKSLDYTINIVS